MLQRLLDGWLAWARRWRRTRLPIVQEEDPVHQKVLEAASREAHQALYDAGVPVQIGYETIFTGLKQKILREKYGLDWKPPRPSR